MKKNPLSAFGIARFLHDFWQKKPLVLRGIAPALATALGRDDLIDLACSVLVGRILGKTD